MGTGLGPSAMRGDHEPGRASLLASRALVDGTAARQEPRPTANGRFMESGLGPRAMRGDHEPKMPRTWPSAPRGRFMESGLFLLDLLSGHEPESAGKPAHSKRCARNGWAGVIAKRMECGGSPPLSVLGSWRATLARRPCPVTLNAVGRASWRAGPWWTGRRLGGSLALPADGSWRAAWSFWTCSGTLNRRCRGRGRPRPGSWGR